MPRANRPLAVFMILIVGLSTLRAGSESEQLVRELGDARFRTRAAAELNLIKIGRQALPALQVALTSDDLELIRRAERVLHAIKTSPEYLVEELRSDAVGIRMEAIEGLRQLGEKARPVIPTLLKMLNEKDEVLRGMAAASLTAIDPHHKALENEIIPEKAHVNRNYSHLLRKILVPQSRAAYGDFYEYGPYERTNWAGHKNIPAGHWVYVYPHWYIWGEAKVARIKFSPRAAINLRAGPVGQSVTR